MNRVDLAAVEVWGWGMGEGEKEGAGGEKGGRSKVK